MENKGCGPTCNGIKGKGLEEGLFLLKDKFKLGITGPGRLNRRDIL